MNFRKLFSLFLPLFIFQSIKADPPEPEVGTRWVLNSQYSDEFNGTSLDKKKWRNSYNGWEGRMPAKFIPKAVSVKDGYMQIENGIIKKKKEHKKTAYTIRGGAVQSLKKTAHYGYYECKFKASRINMSTTFWMSNGKVAVEYPTKKSGGINCEKDAFSQELDICESIGGKITRSDGFRKKMNFNTHFRYIDCNGGKEKFYSRGNNVVEGSGSNSNAVLSSESWEDFHIYAAHWKNPNEVDFYADNKLAGKIKVSTEVIDEPFARPMGINMVTETYNWAKPYPTNKELKDKSINTSYYDWVRSYKLIGVNQFPEFYKKNKPAAVFKEDFKFFEEIHFSEDKTTISLPCLYKINEDRVLVFEVTNANNQNVFKTEIDLYSGYGKDIKAVTLKEPLKATDKITVKIVLANNNEIIKPIAIK